MAVHRAGRALEVARGLEELRARRPRAEPFAELLHVQREGQRVADDRRVERRRASGRRRPTWTRRRPRRRRPPAPRRGTARPSAMAAAMLDGNRAALSRRAASASLPGCCSRAPSADARSTTRPSSGVPRRCARRPRRAPASRFDRASSGPPRCRRAVSYRFVGIRYGPYCETHGVAQRDEQEGDPRGHERAPRRDLRAEVVDRGDRQARRRRQDDDLPVVAEQGRGRHRRVRRAPPRAHADPRRPAGTRGHAEHLSSLVEQYSGPQGRLVAQIIAESQYDESTLHEFRERFWDGRRAATLSLVKRGVAQGSLREDLDPGLMVELMYSAVYVRLLFRYRSSTDPSPSRSSPPR